MERRTFTIAEVDALIRSKLAELPRAARRRFEKAMGKIGGMPALRAIMAKDMGIQIVEKLSEREQCLKPS